MERYYGMMKLMNTAKIIVVNILSAIVAGALIFVVNMGQLPSSVLGVCASLAFLLAMMFVSGTGILFATHKQQIGFLGMFGYIAEFTVLTALVILVLSVLR